MRIMRRAVKGSVVSAGARQGKRRGQSLVELAVAMPVLFVILLGTIDLGRMYFNYIDIKAAARNGAGYGQLKPSDYPGMVSRALSSGVPAGTTATAGCTGSCNVVGGTGTVQVTVNSTFQPVTLSFFSWLGSSGTVTLSATAKMRVLS